jgi:hypothetical protein
VAEKSCLLLFRSHFLHLSFDSPLPNPVLKEFWGNGGGRPAVFKGLSLPEKRVEASIPLASSGIQIWVG